MGTVLRSGTAGILWGNTTAITLQTHCLMRKKNKDKCGSIQSEFGSSNVAHAGSLWIFLLENSVQSVSPPSA